METRFLDFENKTHMRAWALLIMEFREFGGELEDTRENIEMDEKDAVFNLKPDGFKVYLALRDLGIKTRYQVDEWVKAYALLLDIKTFPLVVKPDFIDSGKTLVMILDKNRKGQ